MIKHPDLLEQVIYPAHSIREVWDGTIKAYLKTQDQIACQIAAQLGIIDNLLKEENLDPINKLWVRFDAFVRGWTMAKGIIATTYKRQKSFFSIMNKLALFLDEKKPLSTLSDVLGYRIIIDGPEKDNSRSVSTCYRVLNSLIRFFSVELEPNCSFLVAEPRSGRELSSELARENGIFVPKRSGIMPGFSNNVKDYVRHPKENGYQALHLFVELNNRLVVEIQIRTSAMHSYAERGDSPACHMLHKQERYSDLLLDPNDIDFSRLHIEGVSADKDEVALFHSVPSFIGIPE